MDSDQEARALLTPLHDQPAPQSTLEVAGLVVAGRRRRRVRAWAGASATAVVTAAALVATSLVLQKDPAVVDPVDVVVAAPKPPAFPTSCTSTALPVPAGAAGSFVSGGDSSGRYLVGGYADGNGNRRPLLWDKGKLVTLDVPGDDNSSIVVNSKGVVAGSSTSIGNGDMKFYNWVYRNGRADLITAVGTGPVEHRGVIDINSRGDILLDSRIRVAPGQAQHEGPAIWSDGALRELAPPVGKQHVSAYQIDDDGSVIGRHLLEESFAGERILLWTGDGRVRELAAPPNFGPAGSLRYLRNGWVAGGFKVAGKPDHEPLDLVGNLATGRYEPTSLTMSWAVNRHGWVAGFVRTAQFHETPMIVGGGMRLALPASRDAVNATSISDDGRTIGGIAGAEEDNSYAVMWTCRP